jgi:superfamily II DNA or RNA helicase
LWEYVASSLGVRLGRGPIWHDGAPRWEIGEQVVGVLRLEDIRAGKRLRGISPDGNAVEVLSVEWYGEEAIRVVYRDGAGSLGEGLLYRDAEATLELAGAAPKWSFDGDGALLRLVSEAMRIRLAHLFDPYLAVHTSRIEPLPHQITAVYSEMLPRQPLRFLLADDPGAGKTIMTGLFVKELLVRGDLERCLVVAPGNLVEQWQDELLTKFGLSFSILSRERAEAARLAGNPFEDEPLLIARLDMLSRSDDLKALLEGASPYDLVVVDEAHKMSASYTGGEVRYTKRYYLGELLRERARHFLLLSATPHSGKREDFELFMALLDEDRFEGRARGAERTDASDLMRRLVKEELYTFDGRPLFPERRAYTVQYALTPKEAALYEEVTTYVREEMNRAERFALEGDDRRRLNVGFALQILQRRLASSPEAIYSSLRRRRERLEGRLAEARLTAGDGQEPMFGAGLARSVPSYLAAEDLDDAPAAEFEAEEERILDAATAAATVAELRAEIETLRGLEERARRVRYSGTDAKWNQLAEILDHPLMTDEAGGRRKLIIFTEARDTLSYLVGKIRTLRGRQEEVVEIHGGLSREERRAAVEAFTHDPEVLFLVATDAAGEGVNLQRAHLMVNYDLPWNPNRLEQRFGRIHRIGQKEVCHLWNLVASDTREGEVYARLLEKLEREREDLGGRVYDVLGRLFEKRPLRELLVEAIRYGERPEVRARLSETVEEAVDRERLVELLEERALAQETMDPARVGEVREQMERAEARRLQPHFVRSFFLEAFGCLGGAVRPRERGLWEVTRVPRAVQEVDRRIGRGAPVARAYERIFFEKESGESLPPEAFVCPGHPLLEATIDLLLERHRGLLERGAVLVDEADEGEEARALFYLEHAVADGRVGRDGRPQVISRRLQFVERDEKGEFRDPGPAPYLDYRPLEVGERELLGEVLAAPWLQEDVEAGVLGYAVRELVPWHVREVAQRRLPLIEKVEREVEARLKAQINYWDRRAQELKEQERAGRQTRLSSANAAATAEELAARLERRRDLLARERRISALPPSVRGGAVVVPGGLLRRLKGERILAEDDPDVLNRQEIERLAMEAVMEAERSLGREPRDVSAERGIGYDVESKDPKTGSLLFIEVKGKWEGKDDLTMTKNEILCSRNEPEKFRLAVVVVGENGPRVPRYLEGYHFGEPDFAETTRTFSLRKLIDLAGEPV